MILKALHHYIFIILFTFAVMLPLFCPTMAKADDKHTDGILFHDKPAANWEKEALPLGNGRLGCMVFSGCDGLTVILAAGTNYVMNYARKWKGEHPHVLVTRQVDRAAKQSCPKLLEAHVQDHQSLYNRLAIDLGETENARLALPIDQRLQAI
ncbi:MAG: glycoside hydrolase N-terminal domain-containing protein [Phycisphaerae bacterium]|nr:glycoside hydrolase N-terminal domain-containing protein [Phycisphaerae bacterium]